MTRLVIFKVLSSTFRRPKFRSLVGLGREDTWTDSEVGNNDISW